MITLGSRTFFLMAALCLASSNASAQTNLPDVTVTAPAYMTHHGGYLISSDFKVDPRMPQVVFPAQALVKDDVLSIQPINLNDDEYLVLQECASADCSKASIVRVWDTNGVNTRVGNSENRIWIQHENKYFIWLTRLPEVSISDCDRCGTHFTTFDQISPPMTIVPNGELAQHYKTKLSTKNIEPMRVQSQTHEGSTYVVTFEGGSTVRIKRMHAERSAKTTASGAP